MRLIDAESSQNIIFVSDLVIEEMKKIPTVDVDRPTRSQLREWRCSLDMSRSYIARTVNTETQKTSGVIVDAGTHRSQQTIMIFVVTEKGEKTDDA